MDLIGESLVGTAKVEFEAVRRTKVYEGVARQIERQILDGALQPGDKLPPERELAEQFQVSRSAVRDAIRTLEMVGLLEPRHGEGTIVRDLSPDSLVNPLASILVRRRELVAELLDVRKMLEPPLARRAALRASAEEVAHLEDILRRQKEKLLKGELAIDEDSEFHYAIAQAAKNRVVLKVLDVLMDLLRETRERSLQVEGRREKSFAGHRRIFRAIKRRDPAAAEAAVRRHLEEIERILLKTLRP
jgi:GntR family transcriptional regulator, transcriptional repressor for pyruvate dehydrogenase complex